MPKQSKQRKGRKHTVIEVAKKLATEDNNLALVRKVSYHN